MLPLELALPRDRQSKDPVVMNRRSGVSVWARHLDATTAGALGDRFHGKFLLANLVPVTLGAKLLDRTTRSVRVTEVGAAFLEDADRLL